MARAVKPDVIAVDIMLNPKAIPAVAILTTGLAQEDEDLLELLILFAILLIILPFALIGIKGTICDAHKSPQEYLLLQNGKRKKRT